MKILKSLNRTEIDKANINKDLAVEKGLDEEDYKLYLQVLFRSYICGLAKKNIVLSEGLAFYTQIEDSVK